MKLYYIFKKTSFEQGRYFYEFLLSLFDCKAEDSNRNPAMTLVIYRLDAIGDYLLFRNFLKKIKESERFKGYRIVLAGNKLCGELIEHLDNKYIDEFIGIDLKKLFKSIKYRNFIIKEIQKLQPEIIFQPAFSRFYYIDSILRKIKSEEKIGIKGDRKNISHILMNISNRFFSKLITVPPNILFDFDKNKFILSHVLESEIKIDRHSIEINNPVRKIDKQYVVISPDASVKYKRWHPNNFAATARVIHDNYGYSIVIVGLDKILAEEIISKTGIKDIYDFSCKTSLPELLELIFFSEAVIANDSAAVHIAAGFNKKTICVFNGTLFGRFVPYPPEQKNIVTVMPKNIDLNKHDTVYYSEKFSKGSTLAIDDVKTEEVIDQIKILF